MARSSSGGKVQKLAEVATVEEERGSPKLSGRDRCRRTKSHALGAGARSHPLSFARKTSTTILVWLLFWMLSSCTRSLLRHTRPLAPLRIAYSSHRALSLAHRPSSLVPPPQLARPHRRALASQAEPKQLNNWEVMSIDPAAPYKPNAPSPFIVVNKESALDHLLAGYERVKPTKAGQPEYAVFKGDLEQSPNDDRQYR